MVAECCSAVLVRLARGGAAALLRESAWTSFGSAALSSRGASVRAMASLGYCLLRHKAQVYTTEGRVSLPVSCPAIEYSHTRSHFGSSPSKSVRGIAADASFMNTSAPDRVDSSRFGHLSINLRLSMVMVSTGRDRLVSWRGHARLPRRERLLSYLCSGFSFLCALPRCRGSWEMSMFFCISFVRS